MKKKSEKSVGDRDKLIRKRKLEKKKRLKERRSEVKFVIMSCLIIILSVAVYFGDKYIIDIGVDKIGNENIIVRGGVIEFSSLSLEQKIAQMIMVRGDKFDSKFNKLNIGGVFLDSQNSEEEYSKIIEEYNKDSKIKLFIATDLEGSWTPFHNPEEHQIFPALSEIQTKYEAEEIGFKQGRLLKEIGFNMNFAPVAEYSDEAYGGRAFSGTDEEIAEKIEGYINGLQQNVLGVCKHYPGRAMIKNLHEEKDIQEISEEDLYLFEVCKKNNIHSIMVSHQIVSGSANSNNKPSSVSWEVISEINKNGEDLLIIADEINMNGLSMFYDSKIEMYEDLINSGNNLILDFSINSKELYFLIQNIKKGVESGSIDEDKINESVKRILNLKGYAVK